MFLLFLILSPLILAHLLIMWFETEFIVEYAQLFKLDKIIPILKTFKQHEQQGSPLNFKEFLISNYNSFLTCLITCPVCLSTVLSLILNLIIGAFISWRLGLILWLPIAYGGLFFYELVKKLIR